MLIVLALLLSVSLNAQDAYRLSVISLAGASVMDAASSLGHREGNPVLRGSEAAYGWQGVAIKAGIVSGVLLAERLILRHNPRDSRTRKALTIVNFSAAGATTAVAAHNWRIP